MPLLGDRVIDGGRADSSVQLMATVSTSGVLAEEKRRLSVARFAEARNPPTGEIAPNSGRSRLAAILATSGPRQPTAITRKMASRTRLLRIALCSAATSACQRSKMPPRHPSAR
jgi:hypothetical protein